MEDFKVSKMTSFEARDVYEIESTLIAETSYEKILSAIESETLDYYVLKNGDNVVGFYEVSIVSPEAELFDIAIKSKFQGKGLSKILMEHLFSVCRAKKVDTVFLEVNSINTKAINLYNKFGFQPYSIRKNYYGENDAVLMKVKI